MSTLRVGQIQSVNGTNSATIDSNGYLFAKLPHFLIRNTSAQSIPDQTYTRAEYDDTVLDTHSFADLSNNRINFNSTTAGVYQINFGGKVNNASAARIGYWLRKEGVMSTGPYLAYFEMEASASSGSYAYPTYSFIYNFNDGDFLELDMYHNHGSALNTYPPSQAIGFFMSGVRIG